MSPLPPRRPLDHLLVEAAQARTNRNRGPSYKVARIILVFGDGTRELIDVSDRLRIEAKRSRRAIESEDRADEVQLGITERNLLQAVAESAEPVTADEAAELAGYPPGTSKIRTAMSSLVKKRCVAKKGGYVCTVFGRQVLSVSAGGDGQSVGEV